MASLTDLEQTFRHWLHMKTVAPLHFVCGTIAANYMQTDPVWGMLVGGPGWGKTELLNSTSKLPNVHAAATITEAALLSGTRRKEKSPDAKGGLLREIGDFGFLILKDFTSILSMNRDVRGALLAALREIYDGAWTRHVGVDGGTKLPWAGKLAVLAGCTGTYRYRVHCQELMTGDPPFVRPAGHAPKGLHDPWCGTAVQPCRTRA
jgi:hypothetical protein